MKTNNQFIKGVLLFYPNFLKYLINDYFVHNHSYFSCAGFVSSIALNCFYLFILAFL